ncbi:hypothetical protein R3P38DRAFT_1497989 [Favolaschia claudopus]|uniref:Secreted protein n=1 Tax=Favolaschia claudopus TaxID=2862362 RepID=A0AAW0AJD6_9AGAR
MRFRFILILIRFFPAVKQTDPGTLVPDILALHSHAPLCDFLSIHTHRPTIYPSIVLHRTPPSFSTPSVPTLLSHFLIPGFRFCTPWSLYLPRHLDPHPLFPAGRCSVPPSVSLLHFHIFLRPFYRLALRRLFIFEASIQRRRSPKICIAYESRMVCIN